MSIKIIICSIVICLYSCGVTNSQSQYFPNLAFYNSEERNNRIVQWYTKHLSAMGESSLFDLSKSPKPHLYRFLWLRSFHHPVMVRLSVESNGSGILTVKMTSGAGGYAPGQLKINRSLKIPKKQVDNFLSLLQAADFWEMPTREQGLSDPDGARWTIEGVSDCKYHIVDRQSPDDGDYRKAALLLIQLSKLKLKKDEIY